MSLFTNDFEPHISKSSTYVQNKDTETKDIVLIISPSQTLYELFGQILDTVGAQVVQATSSTEAIEKAKNLRPNGIVVDLDFDGNIGFDLLRAFSCVKHQLAFLAATSVQSTLQHESYSFGAEIFFKNEVYSILRLQSLFIATFRDKSKFTVPSKISIPICSKQVEEYELAHQILRQSNTEETLMQAINHIEKLGRKSADPKLLSAKNYARQTGSTVQLSAYFNAYFKQISVEDGFSKIVLIKH